MQTDWQSFLDHIGARRDEQGVVQHFHNPAAAELLVGDHLALLRIEGADRIKFLQGQLTTDLRQIEGGHTHLGMHLSLKGRGLTSFRLLPAREGIDLLVPRALADEALQRLGKYAAFSKVTLARDDSRVALLLHGSDAASVFEGHGIPLPNHPGQSLHAAHSAVARLETGERYLLVLDKVNAIHLLDQIPVADIGAALAWRLSDIFAGEGHIQPGAGDLWLPQVLNYDVLDGVSFNKGCYLGQEVVARMHFKGKLKQRMRGISWEGKQTLAPGTVLRNAEGGALGEIVDSVAVAERVFALAVLRLDHSGPLAHDELLPDCRDEPMPYPLPALAQEAARGV